MIGSSDGQQYEDHFDRMIDNPIPKEAGGRDLDRRPKPVLPIVPSPSIVPKPPDQEFQDPHGPLPPPPGLFSGGPKMAANVVKGNLSQMDVQIEGDTFMPRVSNPPEQAPTANRKPTDAIPGSAPTLPSGQFQINTDYKVKSGAVASKDSNTVYIDPSIPHEFHPFLAVHEETEKRLMHGGMDYDKAHIIATLAEKHAVEASGRNWDTYTDEVDPHVAKASAQKNVKGPPDPHVNPEDAIGHHADKAKVLEHADKKIGTLAS